MRRMNRVLVQIACVALVGVGLPVLAAEQPVGRWKTIDDKTGKAVGSVELSDELFAAPVNTAVLHQVVTAQLAGRRTGPAA